MNQILPYIKVNLTLFFVLLFPIRRQTLPRFSYGFTLKLFECKGGQGMNGTDMLMCDIVIYHCIIIVKCSLVHRFMLSDRWSKEISTNQY